MFIEDCQFFSILDKMCVPHKIHAQCEDLVSKRDSEFAQIICVPARDR